MADTQALLEELKGEIRAVTRLDEIRALLGWDQQTLLAAGGHVGRAEHLALISTMHHARFAAPRVGDLLRELDTRSDLDDLHRTGARLLLRDWKRAVAISPALVEHLARLQGKGHAAWMAAREAKDFRLFLPVLSELLAASRERAEILVAAGASSATDPYDILIDEFEPGMTAARLTELFSRLRQGLRPLIDAIRGATPMPALSAAFSTEAQLGWCKEIATAIGYDIARGRLDVSTHPFTTRLGAGDIRITTYLDEHDPLHALGATMHEAGHAMYEQGLPQDLMGSGVDSYASMGMHESQSRFWENTIGRSAPFFRWLAPRAAQHFGPSTPDALRWYRAANRVSLGTNRVMADEVTYNLHVIVRFEIERDLFSGALAVADLRDAWNEAYQRDLTAPRDDVEGVLQDIHWSAAAFGYFPTYTLGNLYSAAIGRKMSAELPDLWDHVERGEFAPILAWLRDRVHRHGRRWPSEELVSRITREGDQPTDVVTDLVDYLWARHGALHGVSR